ncbi:MAG TPA: SUMF1/EgtB/PvdO family nonheme iron enzyme [Aggregatilineales bacterium]|nr:SUMF1/EgtB/PvdO family nonheme iron enzyme [Aggregatilineales bacterium]
MPQIFISYSSKDRAIVEHLADDLEFALEGWTVWFDRELNRSGGQKWWEVILAELRQSDVVITALSPHIIPSKPCELEHAYALALGKPVLPIKLVDLDFRDLHVSIREAQVLDYTEPSRKQLGFIRDSLRRLPAAPPLPANWQDLAPPVPMDPVSLLFDRIKQLSSDNREQAILILEIDDLQEDDRYRAQVPDLLERLTKRDDVLTVRNLRRAEELLAKSSPVGTPLRMASAAPISTTPAIVREATPPPEPAAGTRMTDAHGIPMVYVPAGKFLMGSTPQQVEAAFQERKKTNKDTKKEWYEDQMPQHEQIIWTGFWLDLTPVTNQAYARFVEAGGYQKADYWTSAGWEWLQAKKVTGPEDYNNFTAPQQPRVGVNWFEAWAYARWRGGRLPTEAEWEWAARGPENRVYPWGNNFEANRVIYKENSGGKTAVVGEAVRKSGASWAGSLDLSGNVLEWCSSLYQPYPFDAQDGREDSLDGSNRRALRGGSWYSGQFLARAASRLSYHPYSRDLILGFRVASAVGSVPPSL